MRGSTKRNPTGRRARTMPRATGQRAGALPSPAGRRAGALQRAACLLAVVALLTACSGQGHAAGNRRAGIQGGWSGGRGPLIVGPLGPVPMRGPLGEAPGTRPQISVGRIPPASSGETIELPLDSYEQLAGQEQAALAAVRVLLIQRCMQAKGFSYPAAAPQAGDERLLQNIEAPQDGITSLAQAETYGYARPRGAGGPGPPGGKGSQPMELCGGMGCLSAPNLRAHSKAWLGALLGFFPGARARTRPRPGCFQTAQIELSGRRYVVPDLLPGLAEQAAFWTQSDPRILAVQRSWSACMATRGYHYQTVLQPEHQRWPSAPTRTEIATAVADVSCKTRVNLPNTWLAVEAAYQRALIAADITALSQWQATFSGAVHRAETLLGAG
jgi:hypothetical protein